MTTLIATSVVRDNRLGEVDGGTYLVDLDRRRAAQVFERQGQSPGRWIAGWAGGLRGIAFDQNRFFVVAHEELFAFSPTFEPMASYRSPYLKDCRGISLYRDRLFLISAGYDSILGFDLEKMRFALGLHIAMGDNDFRAMPFDPAGQKGPQFANRLELNSVFCNEHGLFISGRRTNGLLLYGGRRITRFATLPEGVHDARPWKGGVLFNDSEAGVVRFVTPEQNHVFRVPRYPGDPPPGAGKANPTLARGLCTLNDHVFAAGSSPSTITLHDVDAMQTTLAINISTDARSAIYGLEVWPYET